MHHLRPAWIDLKSILIRRPIGDGDAEGGTEAMKLYLYLSDMRYQPTTLNRALEETQTSLGGTARQGLMTLGPGLCLEGVFDMSLHETHAYHLDQYQVKQEGPRHKLYRPRRSA